jgi:hypothetical protein
MDDLAVSQSMNLQGANANAQIQEVGPIWIAPDKEAGR